MWIRKSKYIELLNEKYLKEKALGDTNKHSDRNARLLEECQSRTIECSKLREACERIEKERDEFRDQAREQTAADILLLCEREIHKILTTGKKSSNFAQDMQRLQAEAVNRGRALTMAPPPHGGFFGASLPSIFGRAAI